MIKSCIILLLLQLYSSSFCQYHSNDYFLKDIGKAKKGFINCLIGKWKCVKLNDEDTLICNVTKESEEWFNFFLSYKYNPYLNTGMIISKEYFLSYGKPNPDKVITEILHQKTNKKFRCIETVNEITIDITSLFDKDDLINCNISSVLDTLEIPILSMRALDVFRMHIENTVKNKSFNPFTISDSIYSFIYPKVDLNGLRFWKDRIELFLFKERVYLSFYKFAGYSATDSWRGLYWFGDSLRKKYNVPIEKDYEREKVLETIKNLGK